VAEFAFEPEPEIRLAPGESAKAIEGKSPWRIAGRRFVRDRLVMAPEESAERLRGLAAARRTEVEGGYV